VSNEKFSLEHFYTGRFLDQPEAPRVLARSSGVTRDTANAILERANLPPLPVNNGISWALIRGTKQLPFIFVQAQVPHENIAVNHYILMPLEVLRTLGGNLKALQSLLQDALPHPRDLRDQQRLMQVELTTPAESPPDDEAQVDAMLTLMDIAGNRLDVVEKLLAAIVQGVQIMITQAPMELNNRLDFLLGLLALLPPSVRFAVTFTTHSLASTDLDVQIRFLDEPTSNLESIEALVFNWQSGELTGIFPDDEYSHFIISQLRLDTSLVIERTQALTPAAGWRMRQSDKLSDALAYASHRAKLDSALLNNQPADKDDVARVLETDPTLSQEMRVVYAEHLLNLSLAMNDFNTVDVMADLVWQDDPLSQFALQRLSDTLTPASALSIYRFLTRVLQQEEAAEVDSTRWTTLLHRAALMNVTALTREQKVEALLPVLEELASAPPALHLERVAGRLIESTVPLATTNRDVAKMTFILAILYLNDTTLRRLLTLEPFVAQLPSEVSTLIPYLLNRTEEVAPGGLLMRAVNNFDTQWRSTLLLRFAEIARAGNRIDLLDAESLDQLLDIAVNQPSQADVDRLMLISQRMTETQLLLLNEQAASKVLQLRLALGDYTDLASQMIQQSSVFYLGDRQLDYINMLERVFANTAISSTQAALAIHRLENAGIRSAPLVMAGIGALQNRNPSPELDETAKHLLDTLAAEPVLFSVLSTPSLIQIMRYYLDQGRVHDASHAAGLLASGSVAQSEDSQSSQAAVMQMYRLLADRLETRSLAPEVLRIYVREAGELEARTAIATFGREFGGNTREALETVYFVRELVSGQSLMDYAQAVKSTVEFLQDVAASYTDRDYPTLESISAQLGAMKGAFSREERRALTRALMDSARSIVSLYDQYRNTRSPGVDKLLNATTDPNNTLEALWVIAGYFSEGRRQELRLKTALPNPLAERSRRFLYQEVLAMNYVIGGIMRAASPNTPFRMRSSDLRDAIASLKLELNKIDQQEVTRSLSADLQRLATLIENIGERGDPKALDQKGLGERLDSGRYRPRTALEFLRFLYGYYSARG
jgi:hypothetical protein